jgi:hypothetical protein
MVRSVGCLDKKKANLYSTINLELSIETNVVIPTRLFYVERCEILPPMASPLVNMKMDTPHPCSGFPFR